MENEPKVSAPAGDDDESELEQSAESEMALRVLKMQLLSKGELDHRQAAFVTGADIGVIRAEQFHEKQSRLIKLLWLRKMKEQKLYRKVPEIGTWVNLCKVIGVDREATDRDLTVMANLADEFVRSLVTFGWTPSEVKALARAIKVDEGIELKVTDQPHFFLDGKEYSFDPEHKEETLEAIAGALQEKEKSRKKAEGELAEAQKEHDAETRAFKKQVKELQSLTLDPEIPEHFKQIFESIHEKTREIARQARRLDFERTFAGRDDYLAVKADLTVSITIMEREMMMIVEDLKDAIIGK